MGGETAGRAGRAGGCRGASGSTKRPSFTDLSCGATGGSDQL
jgi:hypothetical protein